MGFTVKKCPHCGASYEFRSSHDYGDHFGCPIKMCLGCKKVFIDKEFIEPGLNTFESLIPSTFELILDKGKFANIFIGGFFIVIGLMLLNRGDIGGLGALGICGLGVLFLIPVIRGAVASVKGIDDKTFEEYRDAYLASLDRLQNDSYLAALKAVGYTIPEYLQTEDKNERIAFLYEKVATCKKEGKRIIYLVKDENKEPLEKDSQQDTQKHKDDDKKLFCRICGTQLPIDSRYCLKCGQEVG